MCSLENEPWRANFTGPLCRCGIPTERPDDVSPLEVIEQKRTLIATMRQTLEKLRTARIAALINKHRDNK